MEKRLAMYVPIALHMHIASYTELKFLFKDNLLEYKLFQVK